MSLTASMWTGVSGLKGHGQKMGVIGNNIANVSTLGFKGSRLHFEDFMSQTVNTAGGAGQVGRGVTVGTILGDFSQGALESTNEATDVAITGNGFFLVSPPGEEINYYTRAGNFRFDKEGYFIDPHGYRVQGWGMDGGAITGVPGDLQLENFQSPPAPTENISVIANLDSRSEQFNAAAGDIQDAWDGTAVPPIGANNYTYQSTLRVYDENGGGHNLTVYFRQREPLGGENPAGKYWQFIVTCAPDEDMRNGAAGNAVAGLLFDGEMHFNAAGELADMANLRYYDGAAPPAPQPVAAAHVQNGYPLLFADFLGSSQAVGAVFPDDYQPIELNFGGLLTPAAAFDRPEALATTSYSSSSATLFQTQDGYTAGFLQNVSVSREGVITGRYSNGQVDELFTLTIGDFNNVWGLRREGGNLFAETRDSGPAYTGIATTGRFGTVSSNSLELSNVDLATEFVKMISTQKGFQANSKTITTTDMMLDEVIRMKR
ncbi:flagellar hook protein FlgE [Desulfonatronum zhilinae]|nr:flagellar hook protein FlgE [Desulfonatronum zhilinae]